MKDKRNIILQIFNESNKIKENFISNNLDKLIKASDIITLTIKSGNKLLICGNGGSAADAQHIAAEFVNRFQIERSPLAAIALTTDTSVITSIGNDFSFDEIFSKQVMALGKKGDTIIGISTSGNSKNVIKAFDAAKEIGIYTIGMTGRGGLLSKYADLLLPVESDTTARIQEVHIVIAHILCDIVEQELTVS